MARITVEDCLSKIDNQFDLVMVAAKRARRLANGQDPLVEIENDKPTVIALREIAAGLINAEILEEMGQPEEDILSSEEAEELLANTPLPGADSPAGIAIPAMPTPSTQEAAAPDSSAGAAIENKPENVAGADAASNQGAAEPDSSSDAAPDYSPENVAADDVKKDSGTLED